MKASWAPAGQCQPHSSVAFSSPVDPSVDVESLGIMALTAGEWLGPYEILAFLGAGGMGEVWKARDTRLNRIVAVKRLTEAHSGRFEQEARAIAALNHPHICQIYDIGPDYLVLEYVEGQTLADRIHSGGGPGLPQEEVLRIARRSEEHTSELQSQSK